MECEYSMIHCSALPLLLLLMFGRKAAPRQCAAAHPAAWSCSPRRRPRKRKAPRDCTQRQSRRRRRSLPLPLWPAPSPRWRQWKTGKSSSKKSWGTTSAARGPQPSLAQPATAALRPAAGRVCRLTVQQSNMHTPKLRTSRSTSACSRSLRSRLSCSTRKASRKGKGSTIELA